MNDAASPTYGDPRYRTGIQGIIEWLGFEFYPPTGAKFAMNHPRRPSLPSMFRSMSVTVRGPITLSKLIGFW